jgi:hypothetical protein
MTSAFQPLQSSRGKGTSGNAYLAQYRKRALGPLEGEVSALSVDDLYPFSSSWRFDNSGFPDRKLAL